MNYTIHQLQVFLKVVETNSITKASEELFMTQPAVSIQLRNFQDQFEIPLTEVIGRQLYVTDFGYEVASLAEQALTDLKAIQFKTRDYKGLLTGRLKLSAASTGKYVIPYFLTGFIEKQPGIDLVLDVTNKSRVVESIKNNEVDFALVSVMPEKLDLEQEPFIENRMFLIGNTPETDKNKPLIFREPGSATRMAMENYFMSHELNTRKKLELTSNEAVKEAVIAGMGYSILPLIGLKNEILNKELFVLPARGLPVRTEWRLVWIKGKKLSPVATAYLNYLRLEKHKIMEEHFNWYRSFKPFR